MISLNFCICNTVEDVPYIFMLFPLLAFIAPMLWFVDRKGILSIIKTFSNNSQKKFTLEK